MANQNDEPIASPGTSDIVKRIRARTPARLLEGRAGAAYRTGTQLDLREAHAAARDAVRTEFRLDTAFEPLFIDRWKLFEIGTRAETKDEFLLRPDLGRQFSDAARDQIRECCPPTADLQIVIGDGLSVPAVIEQVPALLPLLCAGAQARSWSVGQTFAIRYCRVGILNEIGELLNPKVIVLLIGERPGLATAESLSAYMAYQPRANHTDANRNLISNIHARGARPQEVVVRILNLAHCMMQSATSGYSLREDSPPQIGK